ncbi:MAG: MarR family transcriptional regulator [Nitriliruptoraceae bacterium]|nr:MarR family transcriptional regulator [Nitriliruptoraceae bacterium]
MAATQGPGQPDGARGEVLGRLLEGPATPSELAAALGIARTTVNDYLRALARHELVERAPELGDGRQRYWRASSVAARRRGTERRTVTLDARLASRTERFQRWLDRQDEFDSAWLAAASTGTAPLALAPDELAALADELTEVVARHRRSAAERARDDRRAVVVQIDAYPIGDPDDR